MTESSQATRSRENTLFLTAFASCASPIATSSNTSFHEQQGSLSTLYIYSVEEEFAGCHRNQFPSHSWLNIALGTNAHKWRTQHTEVIYVWLGDRNNMKKTILLISFWPQTLQKVLMELEETWREREREYHNQSQQQPIWDYELWASPQLLELAAEASETSALDTLCDTVHQSKQKHCQTNSTRVP